MKKLNIHLSTYDKIGLVWGLLVILLVTAFGVRFLRSKMISQPSSSPKVITSITRIPTPEVLIGRMTFNNVPQKVKSGESFSVTVDFTASGKLLDGADAVIIFDPAFLEIEEITTGAYFQEYPRKTMDSQNGVIKVTAYRAKDDLPIKSSVTLFNLKIRAINVGETTLSFDFQKGKTNLSNVVEKGTSKNILGSVGEARITVMP